MRRHFSSGSAYEPRIGVSRGVRAGQVIAIAGTAPIGADGSTVGQGDAALQAKRCLEIIGDALAGLGASLSHVVRTRIMLTHMEDWERVADVHRAFFQDVRPVTTVVQVGGFADRDWLIEIEADAVVEE